MFFIVVKTKEILSRSLLHQNNHLSIIDHDFLGVFVDLSKKFVALFNHRLIENRELYARNNLVGIRVNLYFLDLINLVENEVFCDKDFFGVLEINCDSLGVFDLRFQFFGTERITSSVLRLNSRFNNFFIDFILFIFHAFQLSI